MAEILSDYELYIHDEEWDLPIWTGNPFVNIAFVTYPFIIIKYYYTW